MRFEERELKPYAEPVSAEDLQEGTVYFSLHFLDEEMLVPIVEPVVFIGRDLDDGHAGLYFQDADSYRKGIRFGSAAGAEDANFTFGASPNHIFEFEHALDRLMVCALKRREGSGQP